MRCITCNADLPEGADFCPVCNSTQPEREKPPGPQPQSQPAPEPAAVSAPPPAAAEPLVIIPSGEPPPATLQEAPERPNTRLMIAICAAVVCLLIIQLIVFAVGRANRPRLPANAAPIYLDEERAPVPVTSP